MLLIEAGSSGVALKFSVVPAAYGQIMRTKHDWNLHTTPQAGCDDREIFWTRTKLLGGCSSGNAMMFHYGASTDYDEWASVTNEPECKEWAFDQFHDSFRKFETFHPHPDFPVDESKRGNQALFKPASTVIFLMWLEVSFRRASPLAFLSTRISTLLRGPLASPRL